MPYKYTGKELDSTGLYYYEARYYDPQLGRFISPDTLVESLANPQTLNRYSYVGNNPLRYTDSSGHCFVVCIHAGALGGAVGGAIGGQADGIRS